MGELPHEDDTCFELSEVELDRAGSICRRTMQSGNSSEQVSIRRRRGLSGVEHWRVDQSARLWKVYHETYTFCVAKSCPGPQAWKYQRRKYEMQERTTTMLIVPGEVHITTEIPLSSFFVLRVDPDVVERELPEEARTELSGFAGGQTDRPMVSQHLLSLCESFEDPDVNVFECRALLRQFLVEAFRVGNRQRPVATVGCERAVMRVRDIVRARFCEPLTLELLERETNVSRFYLERSFQAKIGVPIHRYLKLVRLERALRLLREGSSVIDVAHDVGFFDSAHMARIFKTELGFTPSTYARATK